jgi:2'-5' RNA ligase
VTARYAIYFSPAPESPLDRVGTAWLGSDVPQRQLDGFSRERIAEITASARHYGYHATLKPPFALAADRTGAALDRMLGEFAGSRAPIDGLGLKVGSLDGFIALLLTDESTEVRNLATTCVRDFDSFRLAPSEEELRQRRSASLSALEDALLRRWGYPYVMEAFRFHMTLTTRIEREEHDRLLPLLRHMFGAVTNASFTLDAVSLFYQEARDRPFRLIQRYPFAAESARSIATKEAIDRVSGPSLTSVRTSSPST